MRCPGCGLEVEVSVEEAARVLGRKGGRVKGVRKGRELSREEALRMVAAKKEKARYERRRARLYPAFED